MSAYNLLSGMGVVPLLQGEGIVLLGIENLTADERKRAISIALEHRENLVTELQVTAEHRAIESLPPVGRMERLADVKDSDINDHCLAQVRREQTEARSDHEAWRITLKPAQKHICRKLCPEEEKHLQDFIKEKLLVGGPKCTFLFMSGSDLWRLQGAYKREAGYSFRMRPDYLDWHVARLTGAKVMDAQNGQRWLLGIAERTKCES